MSGKPIGAPLEASRRDGRPAPLCPICHERMRPGAGRLHEILPQWRSIGEGSGWSGATRGTLQKWAVEARQIGWSLRRIR